MKKNLFNKNIKQVVYKQSNFEKSVLKKTIMLNFLVSEEIRTKLGFSVSCLSKKSPSSNFRSQCYLTWRTGSFYSFFRLTRLTVRENFSGGLIKGIRKSAW